jgi:hypothetical protein
VKLNKDRWLTLTRWCYVETMADFFVLVICLGVEELALPSRVACNLRWLTVVDRGYRISDSIFASEAILSTLDLLEE